MVEQPEILEHDADAPAQGRKRIRREGRHVVAEQGNEAARRLEGEIEQAQQRCLAGARRTGEELKRMGVDPEGQVAQDLCSKSVTQAHVLESDHARPPNRPPGRCRAGALNDALTICAGARDPPSGAGVSMVSDVLTDAC